MGATVAAFSSSLEPPFRQGGTNLDNYSHSIYNATSFEHRADFQVCRLNARGLQIGGSRKTLANRGSTSTLPSLETRWLDIDTSLARYLGAALLAALSSATWPPPWHGRLVFSDVAALSSATWLSRLSSRFSLVANAARPPSWHGHLVVSDTAAIIAFGLIKFTARL